MTYQSPEFKQQIQEAQYDFPYHYIPIRVNGGFSQVQYWSWGYRYLGGMQVVFDILKTITFDSLVDIGCGDGRFLREVAQQYSNKKLLGIDYSARAIQLANALNPQIEYQILNILEQPLQQRFQVTTLVEVLEHIPIKHVEYFLENTANMLEADGRLILTVPHSNKKLNEKHFQHFDSYRLSELLEPHFHNIIFIPFDARSRIMIVLARLIGGSGQHYVLTNAKVLSWFYRLYSTRYLYTNESNCMRIAVVCHRK